MLDATHHRPVVLFMVYAWRSAQASTVSSLVCRELQETLNRMNKGAQKVSDVTGTSGENLIFRGGVMFCLKDVQRAAMSSTVGEFKGKVREYVQCRDNFVSTMYKNSVVITAFPPLSRAFFKNLGKVSNQKKHQKL
jgi:hypothetical protein